LGTLYIHTCIILYMNTVYYSSLKTKILCKYVNAKFYINNRKRHRVKEPDWRLKKTVDNERTSTSMMIKAAVHVIKNVNKKVRK